MTTNGKVRVAILGGGLAGVAVLHGLIKNENLDVHIFESAPKFREQGQGIGFQDNACWALELLGLRDRLDAAQAVRINEMDCYIAAGPDAGKFAFTAGATPRGTWIVQRAQFLNELLRGFDENKMHPGKKLLDISESPDGPITLDFEDGSQHECDIVIGADGIFGPTRKFVLGDGHPAVKPTFAGWWTVWKLVPFELAQKHLGPKLMNKENPRQYCWCGDGTWIMHDQLANNTLTQCVIAKRDPSDSTAWSKKITREQLHKDVEHFGPGVDVGRNMVELVLEGKDEIDMIPLWHHSIQAPTYARDGLAVVGDAADATTPWKGSGGGMSMEDAYILSAVFKDVKTVSEAKAALKGYDAVNRPRRQQIGKASYDSGMTSSGCDPEVGLSAEKMSDRLARSWDFIRDAKLEERAATAVKAMAKF